MAAETRDDIEAELAHQSKRELQETYERRLGMPAPKALNKSQLRDKILFFAWDLHEGHRIIRGW